MTREVVVPSGHSRPVARYSPGLLVAVSHRDRLLFLSGQVPVDGQGEVLHPGDARNQAEAVFDNLERVLGAAGGTLADLVAVTIYLTDRAHFAVVSTVRNQRLADPPPASTLVYVHGLVEPGVLVEISGIAAVTMGA